MRWFVGAIASLGWAWSPVLWAEYQPFPNGNLSPAIAAFGGPDWQLPRDNETGFELTVANSWASHFALSSEADEILIIDGETWRTDVAVHWRIGQRWQATVILPYVNHSSGTLDDFIDLWHETFSLPDGGRDKRENDLLEFSYRRNGQTVLDLNRSQSGIGDIRVGFSRVLGEARGASVWAFLKLPTGDAERLTGSGATAVTAGYSRVGRRDAFAGRPLDWFWAGAVGYRRGGDLQNWEPNEWVAHGAVGTAWWLTHRLAFKIQVAAATPPFDSELRALGSPSLELILGGEVGVGKRGVFEFGVAEDLVVEAAPDVTFALNFRIKL